LLAIAKGCRVSLLSRSKNRLLAKLGARYPIFAQRLIDAYQPQVVVDAIPWTRPARQLCEAKLALVTTAGIHHPDQPPFDMRDQQGDPSFRVLDSETLFDDFLITHDYYDHRDARKDPNIILPLDRLRELGNEGLLGELAKTHYGFMGHIDGPHISTLVEKTAREVAQRLKADQVDLVLLTPA